MVCQKKYQKKVLTPADIYGFRATVYDYYKKHRRKLPWRATKNPYYILLSEVMLQQTQVLRVIEKYTQFIRRFPKLQSLARASLRDVMEVWQGMGYNRRARFLHQLAQYVCQYHRGHIPHAVQDLEELPGIGKATARSICVFAFNQPQVFIETNIRSVFIYHFFKSQERVTDAELFPFIRETMDKKNPHRWYSALMDYGVFLKQQHKNPGRRSAHHKKQAPFKGSDREIRGMVIKILIKKLKCSEAALLKEVDREKGRVKRIIGQLSKEQLIIKRGKYLFLV